MEIRTQRAKWELTLIMSPEEAETLKGMMQNSVRDLEFDEEEPAIERHVREMIFRALSEYGQ